MAFVNPLAFCVQHRRRFSFWFGSCLFNVCLQFFIVPFPLLELLLQKWNLCISIINDCFLLSNISEASHVLNEFAFKRKRKGQNQARNSSNIYTLTKELSGRKDGSIMS